MPDKEEKPNEPKVQKAKEVEAPKKTATQSEEEDFDFGGIPSGVSFNRNIGCGG